MQTKQRQLSAVFWDADTGKIFDRCHGSTPVGECPRTAAGETVACAGRNITVLGQQAKGRWTIVGPRSGIVVDGAATICPLKSMGL